MTKNNLPEFKIFGGVEKASIVVILLLVIANVIINQREIAVGIGVGGLLFILDFIAIKFLVNSIISKRYSYHYFIFLLIVKLIILLCILLFLLVFAKLKIYGFIIALTAIVLVIIGSGLKGKKHGTF